MHPTHLVAPLALPLVLVYGAAGCASDGPHDRFAPAHRAAAAPDEGTRSAQIESAPPAKKTHDLARFTQAPRPTTRWTTAHILHTEPRIGVLLGLPEGWMNDDPSYMLFFPRGPEPKPPARAVAITLPEPGVTAANKEFLLARGAEPTGMRDAVWQSWQEGEVSLQHLGAAVALGTGVSVLAKQGERKAIAAVVAIDGAPAVGFMGSWAQSEPQHEEAMLDMIRNIERCEVEVGRGCRSERERNL